MYNVMYQVLVIDSMGHCRFSDTIYDSYWDARDAADLYYSDDKIGYVLVINRYISERVKND